MRRKTIEDCHIIAKERGGICLSTEYKNNKSKLEWQCKRGHIWKTNLDSIKSGNWCPNCSGKIKKTIKDCRDVAEQNDGKFLSKEYISSKTKYLWECAEGHQWEATSGSVLNSKSWCPYCAGSIKTIEDCKHIAANRGGLFLSNEYIKSSTKYLWQCDNHHQWHTSLDSITAGNWCPHCSGSIKNSIKDCNELACKNKGECLSDKYANNKSKLKWRCKNNHIWEASYTSIYNGSWCPICCKNSIEDCFNLAKINGGKFLSKEYINNRTKYLWECENGHQWFAQYRAVQKGTWCPKCKKKTQYKLYRIIKDMFPNSQVYFDYRNFDWLKTKNGRKQEIDIFVKDVRLAIEYNGEQHYMAIDHFGGKDALEILKKRDKNKCNKIRRKIREQKDIKYFVVFNYKENITQEYVREKIFKTLDKAHLKNKTKKVK